MSRRKIPGKYRYDILACPHTWDDETTSGHRVVRPTLGTTGSGVVCTECGMLLTWEELVDYMRGDVEG